MITIIRDARGEIRYFVLASKEAGYIISLHKGRILSHYHFGAAFTPCAAGPVPLAPPQGFGVAEERGDTSYSLHRLAQEYPWGLGGDFRSPAFAAETPRGAPCMELAYRRHRITRSWPDLDGLPLPDPESGEEVETLELDLEDPVTGLSVTLLYTPFPTGGAFLRAARFSNGGTEPLIIRRALSFSLDLPLRGPGLEVLATEGGWARERVLERRPLGRGRLEFGSRRGVSGHGGSPALLLAEAGSGEDSGEVIGATLLYSGDWIMAVERAEDETVRFQGGLHPELFAWHLLPGETFASPAALLAHSTVGLGGISEVFHRAARRLMPASWRDRERPVLLNSWEACYFDYDEKRLLELARGAKELGAELFVLDDGWFGRRDNDCSSLGDWRANPRKIPGGLGTLADKVRALGLGFGLWIEPEAVSPDSDLFRTHPDWALALPGREPAEGRNQFILDLSRPEVAAFIENAVRSVLAEAKPDYVKWDMNRPFSRSGGVSMQGELRHRYLLALYGILRRITRDHPETLFEGCAGGGGRMDFGMIPFFPQFWASDNTDAAFRASIQHASSLLFPPAALGAHISASPNHQTGRHASLASRALCAFGGSLGLELDPERMSKEDQRKTREFVERYKARRALIQFGKQRRLLSPYEGGDAAFASVAQDRSRAFAVWLRLRALPNPAPVALRIPGLEDRAVYRVSTQDIGGFQPFEATGSELSSRGILFAPPLGEDPAAASFDIERLSA